MKIKQFSLRKLHLDVNICNFILSGGNWVKTKSQVTQETRSTSVMDLSRLCKNISKTGENLIIPICRWLIPRNQLWAKPLGRIYTGEQSWHCSNPLPDKGERKCYCINSLRPRQNGRRFADDTFKRIFLNENVRISINISLKFVPKVPINNIPALVQILAWRRSGDKPLSEPMMVNLLTHICITRPQWVNLRSLEDVVVILEIWLSNSLCSTQNSSLSTHWESTLRWMPQNLTNDKSTLVQVMVWAPEHYLSQCWPRSLPYHWATIS